MNRSVHLLWGLFCDYFMIDAAGKQSFIGVFERIGGTSFPATHKVMYVACSLTGEPGASNSAVVTIWAPDDTMLLSTPESTLQFSPQGRTLLVHLLYDVTFPVAGNYTVVVEVGGKPAGRLTLEVYAASPGQ